MRDSSLTRLLALLAACAIAACAPPETRRAQGGGPGADIGNRSPVVEMHAGSVIYPEHRCAVRGEECVGPLPWSGRIDPPEDRPLRPSRFVLEEMGRGGAVRRVVYAPPPDLSFPAPEEMELPFPGPEVPVDAPGEEDAAPTEPVAPDDDTGQGDAEGAG